MLVYCAGETDKQLIWGDLNEKWGDFEHQCMQTRHVGMDKSKNLKEGFRACGICLLDENAVWAKLPSGRSQEISNQVLSDAVMDHGCSEESGRRQWSGEQTKRQKRTRATVAAGKSMCTDDFTDPGDAGTSGTGNRTGTDDGAGTSTATSHTSKAKCQHSRSRESSHISGSSSESDANAGTDTSSESDVPLASSSLHQTVILTRQVMLNLMKMTTVWMKRLKCQDCQE